MTPRRTFRCDNCGVDFESEWSQEEAMAEFKANADAGHWTITEDIAVVCDWCYRQMGLS